MILLDHRINIEESYPVFILFPLRCEDSLSFYHNRLFHRITHGDRQFLLFQHHLKLYDLIAVKLLAGLDGVV